MSERSFIPWTIVVRKCSFRKLCSNNSNSLKISISVKATKEDLQWVQQGTQKFMLFYLPFWNSLSKPEVKYYSIYCIVKLFSLTLAYKAIWTYEAICFQIKPCCSHTSQVSETQNKLWSPWKWVLLSTKLQELVWGLAIANPLMPFWKEQSECGTWWTLLSEHHLCIGLGEESYLMPILLCLGNFY